MKVKKLGFGTYVGVRRNAELHEMRESRIHELAEHGRKMHRPFRKLKVRRII